jgi:hypothetical protein
MLEGDDMKNIIIALLIFGFLEGCSIRFAGKPYSGYSCWESILHCCSQCSDEKLTKEDFEAKVQSCEKKLFTKVCDKEQADLVWCMGRVVRGTYSMSPGMDGGGGSISDGCDLPPPKSIQLLS